MGSPPRVTIATVEAARGLSRQMDLVDAVDAPDRKWLAVVEIIRSSSGPDPEETFGEVIRRSIDEVLDGPRTGGWSLDQLEKTEKTYVGGELRQTEPRSRTPQSPFQSGFRRVEFVWNRSESVEHVAPYGGYYQTTSASGEFGRHHSEASLKCRHPRRNRQPRLRRMVEDAITGCGPQRGPPCSPQRTRIWRWAEGPVGVAGRRVRQGALIQSPAG